MDSAVQLAVRGGDVAAILAVARSVPGILYCSDQLGDSCIAAHGGGLGIQVHDDRRYVGNCSQSMVDMFNTVLAGHPGD